MRKIPLTLLAFLLLGSTCNKEPEPEPDPYALFFMHSFEGWFPIEFAEEITFPDGSTMVMGYKIGLVNESNKTVRFYDSGDDVCCPRLSPAGDRITYRSESGMKEINILGGGATTIAPIEKDFGNYVAHFREALIKPGGEGYLLGGYITYPDSTWEDGALFFLSGAGEYIKYDDIGEGYWNPDWSSDGTQILFGSKEGDIWKMNVDGTGLINLTNTPEKEWQPRMSPDGTSILYLSGNGVNLMNPDGTNPVFWVNPYNDSSERNVYWSRDGTSIIGQYSYSSFFHVLKGSQEQHGFSGYDETGHIQNVGGFY